MKRGGRSPGFCNPARLPGNARVSVTGAFVSARLHFVADVPASLQAARLGCLAVGLRRDLPYALAGACVNANVADASASASAANLPLPLKIIVSLGRFLPHALHVAELSVIAHRMVMHIIFSMRVLSLDREAGHVTVHAMHAVRAGRARS